MAEAPKNRRSNAREMGGAPFPDANENGRVESWNRVARESYGRAVYYLDRARRCYLDAYLKPFEISSAHIPILTYLWEGHDGDTQSVIASVVGVDPATVTRVSQKLEELGYLERSVSGRDSRALCLRLTDLGWALADSFQPIDTAWTQQITSHLSDRRRQEILDEMQEITVRARAVCTSAKLSGPGC